MTKISKNEFRTFSYSCSLSLVHWYSQAEEDSSTHLLYEERLERAEAKRIQGNELFQAGEYKRAMAKYATVRHPLKYAHFKALDGTLEWCMPYRLKIYLSVCVCGPGD